ncbi:MAG: YncE family protein [Candidatus Velthaea sp.]
MWQSVGATGPPLPLRLAGDLPLTGGATRFDYASVDAARGTLWLAHMGDGTVEAYDVKVNQVTRTIALGPNASVRGIVAADGNVYAAAQGLGGVVVLDARWNAACDHARRRRRRARRRSRQRAVRPGLKARVRPRKTRNELVQIDPRSLAVIRPYALPGCSSSHSVAIDAPERAAYVGCQANARLVRLDLRTGRLTGAGGAGIGVDVLAVDPRLHRVYAAAESGVISVYDVGNGRLARTAQAFLHLHAHVGRDRSRDAPRVLSVAECRRQARHAGDGRAVDS